MSCWVEGISCGLSLRGQLWYCQQCRGEQGGASGDYGPTALDLQRGSNRYQIDIATPYGYNAAAWLLRDVQANFVGLPNIDTLRLLAWAQAYIAAYGRHTVFIATSGARLISTNSHTEGAAQNSLHIPNPHREFTAVDLSPDNLDLSILGEIMKMPRFGGVGLYKTHVHVDRGRYAIWQR